MFRVLGVYKFGRQSVMLPIDLIMPLQREISDNVILPEISLLKAPPGNCQILNWTFEHLKLRSIESIESIRLISSEKIRHDYRLLFYYYVTWLVSNIQNLFLLQVVLIEIDADENLLFCQFTSWTNRAKLQTIGEQWHMAHEKFEVDLININLYLNNKSGQLNNC